MPRSKKATEEQSETEMEASSENEEKTEIKEEKHKKLTEAEYEKKVLELAEKGMTSEKIGETLRKEGIHPAYYKKISKILKEKGKYVIPDLKNIEKKFENIVRHTEKNRQDKRAMREKEKVAAKLRRARDYFR